jgi:hypothetical protein
MQYKTTTKLFNGKYQYKAVLVCTGVGYFRNGLDYAIEVMKQTDFKSPQSYVRTGSMIKTKEDLDYLLKLHKAFGKMQDYDYRIESPWISVYTNSKSDIDKLVKLDEERVKYVSQPAKKTQLADGTVVMPKKDFEFRITLGKTISEHSAFVEWAEGNKNLQLTKSCKRDLLRDRSWGGTHFYVTGERNITLTKVHLGGSINKIERIVKE